MAWVKQDFVHHGFNVSLGDSTVQLANGVKWDVDSGSLSYSAEIQLEPSCRDEAHCWALMLRRAARRLEEIGKAMP